MSYCNICEKEIPDWNLTNSCKGCFNSCWRRKDEHGNWVVEFPKKKPSTTEGVK